MKDNSIQSKTIEWLRFYCAAAVVLIHASQSPIEGRTTISYENGLFDAVRIFFTFGICEVAVPLFFLISGYLFFRGLEVWNTSVWTDKLKKRAHSLLIPYLLWNVISILFAIILHFGKYLMKRGGRPGLLSYFESIGFGRAFWDCGIAWGTPHDYPLWFIRDLIVLVLLAPAVYYYVKKLRVVGLIALLAFYCLNRLRIPLRENYSMLFFPLGAYFSINRLDFSSFSRKYLPLSLLLSIPLLGVIVFTYGNNYIISTYAQKGIALIGAFATIGVVASFMEKDIIQVRSSLVESAFFIFAAHGTIVLPLVKSVLYAIIPSTSQLSLFILFLLVPAVTVSVLVLCYQLLRKGLPRTLSVLTGGR